jgi:hypothetical protein
MRGHVGFLFHIKLRFCRSPRLGLFEAALPDAHLLAKSSLPTSSQSRCCQKANCTHTRARPAPPLPAPTAHLAASPVVRCASHRPLARPECHDVCPIGLRGALPPGALPPGVLCVTQSKGWVALRGRRCGQCLSKEATQCLSAPPPEEQMQGAP